MQKKRQDTVSMQESSAFFKDFFKHAKLAKKSIWVQTMFFEPGREMEICERLFIRAAKKGIDVRFTIDWITEKYYESNLHIFPSLQPKWKYWSEMQKKRKQILERLKQSGVTVMCTNIPSFFASFFSIAGRNHNKIFIIDGKVAWIGGVNLAAEFGGKDIMVKFTDAPIVKTIAQRFSSIHTKKLDHDYAVRCTPHYTFLSDAGIPRTSIIFDEALAMIKNAKKQILLISQFVPDGKILHTLRSGARDGIAVTIITGDKRYALFRKFPNNFFYLLCKFALRKEKNIQMLHYPGKVHVKLLIIDNTVALFGSHNFVWSGVFVGTEEIAMKTTDKNLLQQFLRFTKKLLKKAELPDEM